MSADRAQGAAKPQAPTDGRSGSEPSREAENRAEATRPLQGRAGALPEPCSRASALRPA